jgi:hypothetical protein
VTTLIRSIRPCPGLLSLVLLLMLGVRMARAQAGTTGTLTPVTLNATMNDRLLVTVVSGAVQTIPAMVSNAVNPFPSPVLVRTEWNLPVFFGGTLSLVAYFTTPSLALVNGASAIPASRVEARMTTGSLAAFTPITGNAVGGVGTAGGTRVLWSWNALCGLGIFCRDGDRTDRLDLRLNLVGHPTVTGTYTGVLNLRAVIY